VRVGLRARNDDAQNVLGHSTRARQGGAGRRPHDVALHPRRANRALEARRPHRRGDGRAVGRGIVRRIRRLLGAVSSRSGTGRRVLRDSRPNRASRPSRSVL
jgi:hypothetical protein